MDLTELFCNVDDFVKLYPNKMIIYNEHMLQSLDYKTPAMVYIGKDI